jgi:hypothetical protein
VKNTVRAVLGGSLACETSTASTVDRRCVSSASAAPAMEATLHASVDRNGHLHAAARVLDRRVVRPQDEPMAQAQAFLADRLTFDGPVVPTSVRMSLFIHGAVAGNPLSFGVLSFYYAGSEPATSLDIQGQTPRGGYAGSTPSLPEARYERATFVVPVVGGRVDFALELLARAQLENPDEVIWGISCRVDVPCAERGARAEFGNTAGLELIEGLDADGAVIGAGLLARSASGTAYALYGGTMSDAVSTVPEPATVVLVGSGLAAAALLGRRRTRDA